MESPDSPERFVEAYESALATQSWPDVEPLMHPDACVTFSDGTVHRGRRAVQSAFESNFRAIHDETYRIQRVHWVIRGRDFAVYTFDFAWTGITDDGPASGAGRGTCSLVWHGSGWVLAAEHLVSTS